MKEIIEKYGDKVNCYIETKSPQKYPGMEGELLDILLEYGLLDEEKMKGKVLIQSYSEESLKLIHNKYKEIPLIQLQGFEKAGKYFRKGN